MNNGIDENNPEFKKASSSEYYDKWMEPYMGYDYTKINKNNAKDYRKEIRDAYKTDGIDNNNQVEKELNPYLKEMKDLVNRKENNYEKED